jgi:hypothetical protein
MAIWNCTDDNNDLGRLLECALPGVNTDAEMLKLSPEQLGRVETMAESFTDNFIVQEAALADLLANADLKNLDSSTIHNAAWLLREICHLHEIVRRISSMARAYGEPETRALHLQIQGTIAAEGGGA